MFMRMAVQGAHLLASFLLLLVSHNSAVSVGCREWGTLRPSRAPWRLTHEKHWWHFWIVSSTALTSQTREWKGKAGVSLPCRKRCTRICSSSWIWHQGINRFCIATCWLYGFVVPCWWFLRKTIRIRKMLLKILKNNQDHCTYTHIFRVLPYCDSIIVIKGKSIDLKS